MVPAVPMPLLLGELELSGELGLVPLPGVFSVDGTGIPGGGEIRIVDGGGGEFGEEFEGRGAIGEVGVGGGGALLGGTAMGAGGEFLGGLDDGGGGGFWGGTDGGDLLGGSTDDGGG